MLMNDDFSFKVYASVSYGNVSCILETASYPAAIRALGQHAPLRPTAYPTTWLEVCIDRSKIDCYKAWRENLQLVRSDGDKAIIKFYYGLYRNLQTSIDGRGLPIDSFFAVG